MTSDFSQFAPGTTASRTPADMVQIKDRPRLRVWLVEDQESFRQLLAEYLGLHPGVELVGSSTDHEAMMPAVEAGALDVVILDLMLENTGGLAILRRLAARPEGPAVLILTGNVSEHSVYMAAHLGARGFLAKNDSVHLIGEALRHVAAGRVFFSDEPRRLLGQSVMRRWSRLDADEASKREIGLLVAILNDIPIKEAAAALNLSVWTTYKLRSSLMEKFAARNDGELARYAARIGLVGSSLTV